MLKLSTDKKLKGASLIAKTTGISPVKFLYLKSGSMFDTNRQAGGGWFNEIYLEKGKFEPVPRKDIVEKLYISGPSNSGKTYYASRYIDKYLKKNRDSEFYLFSLIPDDDQLDDLDPMRVPVDESLVTDPIMLDDLYNSIAVFDDSELVKDKHVKNALFNLQDKIATMGRHTDTRLIAITHLMTNYKESRIILTEATSITFFPHAGASQAVKRVLEVYIGLSKEQIKKVLKLPSRWVTIYKHAPNYLLHERGAVMLSVL